MDRFLLITSGLFRIKPDEVFGNQAVATLAASKSKLPFFAADYDGVLVPMRDGTTEDATVDSYYRKLVDAGMREVAEILCKTSRTQGYENIELHLVDEEGIHSLDTY